jgi:hypothetical protein
VEDDLIAIVNRACSVFGVIPISTLLSSLTSLWCLDVLQVAALLWGGRPHHVVLLVSLEMCVAWSLSLIPRHFNLWWQRWWRVAL